MSIATKTGDKGETSLLSGERARKSDLRLEAYGTVDELNASVGVAVSDIKNKDSVNVLQKVQNDLFKIGAELAAATQEERDLDTPRITTKDVEFIEQVLSKVEGELPKQTEFILPKGTAGATHLHLARTICRRAERRVTECDEKYGINDEILRYLNRLGDLLFVFARAENKGDEAVSYG